MNPVESRHGRRWPAPLSDRIPDDASAEQLAEATVEVWIEIDRHLHPIIGHRGVAALFNRSLTLVAPTHPWLAPGLPAVAAAIDPAALRAALAQQSADNAGSGASALFHTFHDLLASLVGLSLTERLLLPVWTPPSSASPAQDPST